MDRRNFLSSSAIGAAAAVLGNGGVAAAVGQAAKPAAGAPARRAQMKVGATVFRCDDDSLKAVARYGVTHVIVNAQIAEPGRLYATVDELKQQREIVERNKLTLAVMTPPMLASSHIDREKNPAIMLGQSPQRDRDIEAVQTMIKNCAAAGIPVHQVQHEHPRRAADRPEGRPGRHVVQLLQAGGRQGRSPAHQGGGGQSRHVLGADHLLPGARHPRRQRVQGDAWRATRTTR